MHFLASLAPPGKQPAQLLGEPWLLQNNNWMSLSSFLPEGTGLSSCWDGSGSPGVFFWCMSKFYGGKKSQRGQGREPPFKSSLVQCASQSVAGPQQINLLVMASGPFCTCSPRLRIWARFWSNCGPMGSFDCRQSKVHSKNLLRLGFI